MPQIAQQDYKIIAPTPGRGFQQDAAALAKLKKAILNGIGFDCIIETYNDEGTGCMGRVLGFYADAFDCAVYDPYAAEIKVANLPYTVTQYQGLAAIQAERDRIDGVADEFPILSVTNGMLTENGSGWSICTPEGYQYKVTLIEGKVATIEVSTTKMEGDFIAISIEDAQKLIGLPCGS